jgi:predicted lipoprotein with Yx(FWY)xxD motif
VSGTLGTILRPDGSTQTTFDGHPLYTYAGDSGPGQDTGNGITLYGGVWHQIDTPGSP